MSDTFEEIISGNVFDIRDVIQRFEALDGIKDTEEFSEEEKTELADIGAFLDAVRGMGGDEQWNGDWYPLLFIKEDYFRVYAQELAEDIGAISKDATWPNNFIDWDAATDALKQDYTAIDFDGNTFWYR